jgi:hypothetical protein
MQKKRQNQQFKVHQVLVNLKLKLKKEKDH